MACNISYLFNKTVSVCDIIHSDHIFNQCLIDSANSQRIADFRRGDGDE